MGAVANKKLDAVTCPLCNSFSSKRLTSFEKHLQEDHNTTSQDLWVSIHGQVFCNCGCGKATTWKGWNVGFAELLKGHNASIYSIYSPERAAEIALTRGSNWRGKESHWKGKTKETDDATARRGKATSAGRKKAIDAGKIQIWSKDKTKETDERLASLADRQKAKFASGELRPWAEGKTKETDERVLTMALNVSIAHKKREIRDRLDSIKRLNPEETKRRIENSGALEVIGTLDEYINDNVPNIAVKCKTCNKTFNSTLRRLQFGRCVFCHPGGSVGQAEVSRFIQSLGLEVINNTRAIISPLELDILVPSLNFAIEFNGLYTHNELSKSQTYHSNKTDMCSAKNIKLFHLFEDEWLEKDEIVKSMLRHRLGFSSRKIFARKCKIVELDSEIRARFFDSCHIDGDTNAKTSFGLVLEDELVAALSLRKAFHKSHASTLELARFATLPNTSVVGGLARLSQVALKYALEQGYKDGLMTYVDTRHGHGKGYEAAGYKLSGKTTNRFWWTDNNVRFNRFKFRADSKAGLTEADVAAEHGVVKIWGCPNLIFELKS